MENIRRWTIDQQGSGHKKLAVNCLAALHTRRNLDTVCADAQGLTIPVKAILNECITRSGGAKSTSALPRQVDHLMKTITWSAAVEGRYQMLSGADVNTVAWVKETLASSEGRNDVSLRMSKWHTCFVIRNLGKSPCYGLGTA